MKCLMIRYHEKNKTIKLLKSVIDVLQKELLSSRIELRAANKYISQLANRLKEEDVCTFCFKKIPTPDCGVCYRSKNESI